MMPAWTVYNLRRLRVHSSKTADLAMARPVDGYDLLVIVPELTPVTVMH